MLYHLLRLPLVILFFFFYRRIYLVGKENIPKDAPTLVASNHSTAFMEQILVAGLQWRSVYFWAGGAVFDDNPALIPIFKQCHVVPVWKPEAGFKKMQQNEGVFENSKDILLTNKMFFIAPEGISWNEKRLMPFKSGTARLALLAAAENNFEKPVYILPTGVNYTYTQQFRSEVMISFGKPINVQTYKNMYLTNPTYAAKQLTDDLKVAISQEVIIINNKEDDELVEQLHLILRNEKQHYQDKIFSSNKNRLILEQQVANTCNELEEEKKVVLKKQANSYFENLKRYNLDDKAIQQNGAFEWGKILKSTLVAPLAVAGWIGGFVPVNIARHFKNNNIKNKQFTAPMILVFSFINWAVYSLICTLIGAFFWGWMALLIPPTLIALQYLAFSNKEDWNDIQNNWRYYKWRKNEPTLAFNLRRSRKQLVFSFRNELN